MEKEHKRTIKTPPKPRPKSMKLGSPGRDKLRKAIAKEEITLCFAVFAFRDDEISQDEMDLYRDNSLDQIIAIFD